MGIVFDTFTESRSRYPVAVSSMDRRKWHSGEVAFGLLTGVVVDSMDSHMASTGRGEMSYRCTGINLG